LLQAKDPAPGWLGFRFLEVIFAEKFLRMKDKSLTASQLARIDLMITLAQEKGFEVDQVFKTHTDETAGLMDAHHPLFDLSEHDREIITQIRELASQLEQSTSLSDLLALRGQAVKSLGGG
jgi:hypothetical protein